MTATDKVRENRIRRMAARQGLKLQRSPLRDPYATGYATYRLRRAEGDALVLGNDSGNDYGLTLDQVEGHLKGEQ